MWRPAARIAGAILALAVLVLAGAAGAQTLGRNVLDALDRLTALEAVGGTAADSLTERDRALLFANNADINAAALNGEIGDEAYQFAQSDFAALNRGFAADSAHDARADFTVQRRTSEVFSPGTDSDYITVVVDSSREIADMQESYNNRVNAFLQRNGVIAEPRGDWHNKLDTDFMADPRYVTQDQFEEIARLNNDAYSRRHSAEFERVIREPGGGRVDPWHIVAYTEEMDDFAHKKRRHLDEALADPSGFSDPRIRADAFRTMAQQQKYISRIEMAEDYLRAQEGLPPRDRGPRGSIAKLGSKRTYENSRTIRDAYQVSDQSLSNAIANVVETMAEVSRTNDQFANSAVEDITALITRLPDDQRGAILERLRRAGSTALADRVASALAGRNAPDPTGGPPGGRDELPPPDDGDFDNVVLALPPGPAPAGIEEAPLALPGRSEYAGLYIDTANGLARERLALPPSIEDGFVLPEVEDVSDEIGRERSPLWDRLKGEMGQRLGSLAADIDTETIHRAVDEQKLREAQAIRAAYATFVAAMPSRAQDSLIEAETFYDANASDIGKLRAMLGQMRLLSTAARAYYEKGARGLVEVGFLVGCKSLMQSAAEFGAGAAGASFGAAGYYLASAAGTRLGDAICGKFAWFLFTEKRGRSWLTGEVVYAADPVVNEWVRILYTGEIMAGVDRPDLPPGIDFFYAERVDNPRQIMRKFPSQPELHAALQKHWRTLYLEHPELHEVLDVANSELARKVWERIYTVAGETLAEAIREELEAEPKPTLAGASIIDYFRQGTITWPPAGDLRAAPTVIRAASDSLGILEPESRTEVLAKFGVLGLAGLDETVSVRWQITGPGFAGEIEEEDRLTIPFAKDETDPASDLFKVAESRFELDIDPGRFEAGEDYSLIARIEGTDETFRYPFTVAPQEVHFLVSIEGEGYTANFDYAAEERTVDADGTVWIGKSGAYVGWKAAGLHEMWMTLKVGEDHDEAKKNLRRYILSGVCRSPFLAGGGGDPSAGEGGMPRGYVPIVWQRGPKIVTVAGPFRAREEYQARLRRTWSIIEKQRPDGSYVLMNDLAARVKDLADCGGACCAVQCTDPYHCE